MSALSDNERKLLRIHRTHPYAGKNPYGGGKQSGVCPHCGAGPHLYEFDGRWKRCRSCGLDNERERLFTSTRWMLRKGRSVDRKMVRRALEYGIRVYGGA